jgi:hypothetical protein
MGVHGSQPSTPKKKSMQNSYSFFTVVRIVGCIARVMKGTYKTHRNQYLSCFYNPRTRNYEGYVNYRRSIELFSSVNNAVIISSDNFNLPGIAWANKSNHEPGFQ